MSHEIPEPDKGLSTEELEQQLVTELPDREAMTVIDPNYTVAPIEPPGMANVPMYHTQTE
jgi:hypothetical protein